VAILYTILTLTLTLTRGLILDNTETAVQPGRPAVAAAAEAANGS